MPAKAARWAHHRWCVRLAVLVAAALVTFTSSASAKIFYGYSPDGGVVTVVDTDAPDFMAKPPSTAASVVIFNGITWTITYDDVDTNSNVGFDHPTYGDQRKARFEDALELVSSVLNETGSLDVLVAVSQIGGTGSLAWGGTYYWDTPAFTGGMAFDHIQTGSDPAPGLEDIHLTVDFGFNWNEGTDAPGPSEYDLISVLVHEITHGLGLTSLSDASGGCVLQGIENVYSRWDELLERGSVVRDLFDLDEGTPTFIGSVSDLVSDDVVFTGTLATATFGSPPLVYSPSPFNSGSSLSHFDETLTAVMTPFITNGELNREYADFEIDALVDIGWTNAASSSSVWVDFDDDMGPWLGTQADPFKTLYDGVISVPVGGTIYILAGETSETLLIAESMRIEAVGGPVRIGVLGGQAKAAFSGTDAVDIQSVINEALGIDTDFDCDIDDNDVTNAVDIQVVINTALGLW